MADASIGNWSKEDEEFFLGEQWTTEQVERMKSRNLLAKYAAGESLAENEMRFIRGTTKNGTFIEACRQHYKAASA